MKLLFLGILIGALSINTTLGQRSVRFSVEQNAVLIADAGEDLTIVPGEPTVLGGMNPATGGSGSYQYQWEPPAFLDNAMLSNPTAMIDEPVTFLLKVTDSRGCISRDSVQIQMLTDLGNIFTSEDFALYPNPVKEQLHIEISLEKTLNHPRLIIYNQSGQLIFSRSLTPGNSINEIIDIGGFMPGSYFVSITDIDFNISRKIILE